MARERDVERRWTRGVSRWRASRLLARWLGPLVALALCWPAAVLASGEAVGVAVLPFDAPEADAELAPLGKAMADMLSTDLSQAHELRLVERDRLADVRAELALGRSKGFDRKTAARTGKLLGADLLVVGRLTAVKPKLRIDARALSAESGEVVVSVSAEGSVDTFFTVESQLAGKLLEGLGAALSPLAKIRLNKPATRSLPAALAYGRALDAQDSGDREAAKKALSEAVAADPAFAAARARLDALQKRVEALEVRTRAVESAGGRILRPDHAVDHLHNAGIAVERGEHEVARDDLLLALKQRPQSFRAFVLWGRLPASVDAALAAPDRKRAAVARATRAATVDAITASEALRPKHAPGTAAERLDAALRLAALRAAPAGSLRAEERAEIAALGRWLGGWSEDRAVFVREDDVAEATKLARVLAEERGQFVGPGASGALPEGIFPRLRRGALLARPVALATPERRGKGMPWLEIQVRVADAGSRDVVVLPPGSKAPIALVPQQPSPWGEEAALFAAVWPRELAYPKAAATWTIRRVGPRGTTIETALQLPPPRAWGGNWRGLGASFGRISATHYPMLGFEIAPLQKLEEGAAVRLLVDPEARVWANLATERGVLSVAALYGGTPGPIARGVAVETIGSAGERGYGRRLPLVASFQGRPLALGTAWLQLVLPAGGGKLRYVSAVRVGWMDGPLDGTAAPIDVAGLVAALLSAGEREMAVAAYEEAKAGIAGGQVELWLDDANHAEARAALCRAGALRCADVSAEQPSRAAAVETVALPGSGRIDAAPVSVDDWSAAVRAGAVDALLDDHCAKHTRGDDQPHLRGDQPARCLPLVPNPYPVTWVQKREADAFCRARGGRLPTEKEWIAARAANVAGAQVGNVEGKITCLWTRSFRHDELPAECVPGPAGTRPFDGYDWLAPVAAVPAFGANVREWVARSGAATGGGRTVGCSASEPACAPQPRDEEAPAAADVGFRCAYDSASGPSRFRARKTVRRKPPAWRRVPGGKVWVGAPLRRPEAVIATADDKVTAALAEDVPGLSRGAAERLVLGLRKLGISGSLDAWQVEELVTRGRWIGQADSAAVSAMLSCCSGESCEAIAPYKLDPNLDWMRKRHQRAKDTQPLAQWIFDKIAHDLGRRSGQETPKPKGAMVWRDDSSLICDDRPQSQCDDPTGTASNRVSARPRKARQLEVSAFELLETEVTGEQFRAVMGYDPSLWPCSNCPVSRVTWAEADAYCRKIGSTLPTEAQWVRAARGDDDRYRLLPLDRSARWIGNSEGRAGPPLPLRAAPFGHRDLVGGVWEWVADAYDSGSRLDLVDRPIRWRKADEIDPGLPKGLVCWQPGAWAQKAEINLAALPWKASERLGPMLCFADEAKGEAAIRASLLRDPQGPVVDTGRVPERVLVGGSFASDVRLVSASSRVGFRQSLRSPFVGFRCARRAR